MALRSFGSGETRENVRRLTICSVVYYLLSSLLPDNGLFLSDFLTVYYYFPYILIMSYSYHYLH